MLKQIASANDLIYNCVYETKDITTSQSDFSDFSGNGWGAIGESECVKIKSDRKIAKKALIHKVKCTSKENIFNFHILSILRQITHRLGI